jgi:mono/diheme cytochrome c family protein
MSKKHQKKNPPQTRTFQHQRLAHSAAATAFGGMEEAEPVAESRPIPIVFFVLTLVALYLADLYILDRGGDVINKQGAFPVQVYDPFYTIAQVDAENPVDPAQALRLEGQKVFNAACVACHQPNGQGLAGQFPPLAGSEWVMAEGPNRIIRIVLHGVGGPLNVKGADFNNIMPPWRDAFTDAQIAAVLTYVRSEWGNKAGPVSAEQVKKWRDKDGNRGDPMNAADLAATPEKD